MVAGPELPFGARDLSPCVFFLLFLISFPGTSAETYRSFVTCMIMYVLTYLPTYLPTWLASYPHVHTLHYTALHYSTHHMADDTTYLGGRRSR